MNNQTYPQRVRALAEEMAIDHFEKHIAPSDRPENGWDGLTNEQKKIWVEAELSRARIAVAKMGEVAKKAFCKGAGVVEADYISLRAHLKEQGLIPDNETDTDTRTVAGNTIPAGPDNSQEADKAGPNVDRTNENDPDPEILVVLECGFKARFWVKGLTDSYYIELTRELKRRKNAQEAGSYGK